jgi:prepilin-type N-terminal cleavage/methylation domain-containing protein
MKNQTSRITNRKPPRGFTLIEVLIATMLVGFSIAALVAANGTLTMANGAGTDQSTAEFLAEQIRELTAMLAVVDPTTTTTTFGPEEASVTSYDDVDDFDGAVFSPPIAANKAVLAEFAGFSQQVIVQNVSASNLDQVVADHGSQFVRVTVHVIQNGRDLCSISWVRARY